MKLLKSTRQISKYRSGNLQETSLARESKMQNSVGLFTRSDPDRHRQPHTDVPGKLGGWIRAAALQGRGRARRLTSLQRALLYRWSFLTCAYIKYF